MRIERTLSLDGKVLVEKGEDVKPDTIIARADVIPKRAFYLNLSERLKIPPEDAVRALLKREGEPISTGEVLAQTYVGKVFKEKKIVYSPVEGVIERIDKNSGFVVIREILHPDVKPLVINVVETLKIPLKDLSKHLLKREEDRVEPGEAFAGILYSGVPIRTIRSPFAGRIERIDYSTGKVTLAREIKSRAVKSLVWGRVEEIIPKRGVIINAQGIKVEGVWGKGEPVSGILDSDILFKERIDEEDIVGKGFSGVIAGRITFRGWEAAQKENISILVIEGFGGYMRDKEKFLKYKGERVSLFPITQLRAGVQRPWMLIYTRAKLIEKGVRVIWGEDTGEEVELVGEPFWTKLPSGIETWCLVVRFEDGNEKTIPIQNLEIKG